MSNVEIIVEGTTIGIDPNWACGITPAIRTVNGIIQHLYKDIKSTSPGSADNPEYTFEYYWRELRTD